MDFAQPRADRYYSREEFRQWCEAQTKGRYERVDGFIVAMAPERGAHLRVKGAVYSALKRAVADGKVELAIRAEAQAMHVMAAERKLNAEAGEQLFLYVRRSRILGIAKVPEVRDARVPDFIAARDEPGAGAIERIVKALGESADDELFDIAARIAVPMSAVSAALRS